jgi:hypothetical protein
MAMNTVESGAAFCCKHDEAEVGRENDRQLMEWVDWGERHSQCVIPWVCWTVRSLRKLACLVTTLRS